MELSKGEFEKLCTTCFVLDSGDCCNLCLKLASKLDEARKEFPKYADFKDAVFQDNLSPDFHYILAVTQWRLKYLGDQ